MPARHPPPTERARAHRGRELTGLVILTHDHPDPDAMASAWALAHLTEHACGFRPRLLYGGVIGRMENQMMVRILNIPVQPVQPNELAQLPHVALVDTQPPFQNNRFPSGRRATMVVDHHPRHAKTEAEFSLIYNNTR